LKGFSLAKLVLYYGAAAATAVAGMLHLMLGPGNLGFNVNQGILFIVGGIAQVFWIIPMIRKWGTPWYAVGIGGTAVFMALFFITRVQGNPITGRGGGANAMSIAVEVFQAAFIGLAAAILIYGSRKKRVAEKTTAEVSNKRSNHAMILAGIVAALVLIGLFALPMAMPSPMGGNPPRQTSEGSPGAGQFETPQGQVQQNSTGVG
jgi:hypothetical protein